MKRHIIYVPGIGDHRSYGQDIAIQLWRLFGLTPHYLPLGWNTKEGFETKQRRLLDLIETLHIEKDSVALVGISAGASAVLNAYALTAHVTKIICICGKINNAQTISTRTFRINPDFQESMQRLPASLDAAQNKTKDIMSIHPWRDQTVPLCDTVIPGACEVTLPGWNHATGIFFGVILGSLPIARFVRSRN